MPGRHYGDLYPHSPGLASRLDSFSNSFTGTRRWSESSVHLEPGACCDNLVPRGRDGFCRLNPLIGGAGYKFSHGL